MHWPKTPSRMRSSALSTICKSWRSLLLWWNKNSLLYELAARSATSCADSRSASRPSWALRVMAYRSSRWRSSNRFLKASSFFLSISTYPDRSHAAARAARREENCSARTGIICVWPNTRQLHPSRFCGNGPLPHPLSTRPDRPDYTLDAKKRPRGRSFKRGERGRHLQGRRCKAMSRFARQKKEICRDRQKRVAFKDLASLPG